MERTFIIDEQAKQLIVFARDNIKQNNVNELLAGKFENIKKSQGSHAEEYLSDVIGRVKTRERQHRMHEGPNCMNVTACEVIVNAFDEWLYKKDSEIYKQF